jgi:UDPglucose 6-dehydrogenase
MLQAMRRRRFLECLLRDQLTLVSNPEFLRERIAIKEFKQLGRVVVGVDDERASAAMQDIY